MLHNMKIVRPVLLIVLISACFYFSLNAQELRWHWAEHIEGTGHTPASDMAVDSEGNIYVIGSFVETVIFGETELQGDSYRSLFIAKMNNNYEWEWAKNIESNGLGISVGTNIALDNEDNIYIKGNFGGTIFVGETQLNSNENHFSTFFAKLNTNGVWQWANKARYELPYYHRIQHPRFDIDNEGNVYLAGVFFESIIIGETELRREEATYNVFLAKMDPRGDWQWVKGIYSPRDLGGHYGCSGYLDIAVDNDNNVYVTGNFEDSVNFGDILLQSSGSSDAFVSKIDSQGEWQWARQAGGQDSSCIADGINVDNEGKVYVKGRFDGTASFGDLQLQSDLGFESFIAEIDSRDSWRWVERASSDQSYSFNDFSFDDEGNIYVAGWFQETVSFNEIELQGHDDRDNYNFFVAKIEPGRDWKWAEQFETIIYERHTARLSSIDVGYDGNCYLLGQFTGTATFGDIQIQNYTEESNSFIAKLAEVFPYPSAAQQPVPADDSVGVPVDLSRLSWSYEANDNYTDPSGFRVYLNDTGEFDDEDEFVWVPYVEEQVEYDSAEILPEQLEYTTNYYWKVIPTTKEDGTGEGEDASDIPVWSFTTEVNPVPAVAKSPFPEDEAKEVSTELQSL